MPTTFSAADPEVLRLLDHSVLPDHFPRLVELGVRIGVVMAYNPDGGAIKHGGYPAAATIKVVSLKDRVTKGFDAELLVDQGVWDGLRHRQRLSLLYHECRHLEPVPQRDDEEPRHLDNGAPDCARDDLTRPRLKCVPGDWNGGDGFRDCVALFGDDAIEHQNAALAFGAAEAARKAGERKRREAAGIPPGLFDAGGEVVEERVAANRAAEAMAADGQ